MGDLVTLVAAAHTVVSLVLGSALMSSQWEPSAAEWNVAPFSE